MKKLNMMRKLPSCHSGMTTVDKDHMNKCLFYHTQETQVVSEEKFMKMLTDVGH